MNQAEIEQTLNTFIEEQAFSGVISIRQKDHVLYAISGLSSSEALLEGRRLGL
jgi:hypothetical protein